MPHSPIWHAIKMPFPLQLTKKRNSHKRILPGLWPANGDQKLCGQERQQTEVVRLVPLVKDRVHLDLGFHFKINTKKRF